ncbi:hypothetical protein Bbelb_282420 [Branchiostoma belcheri]|nr:hypothetical protein Bbelb_282420 [Branchiostoma belcheri]
MVQNSSKALMWEGLCHLARRDCVREGDGPASIGTWMLSSFGRTNTTNISSSPTIVLTDSIIKYFSGIGGFLPARLRHDLIWNRTGNIKGCPGRDVGLDLINEFLNNDFKGDPRQEASPPARGFVPPPVVSDGSSLSDKKRKKELGWRLYPQTSIVKGMLTKSKFSNNILPSDLTLWSTKEQPKVPISCTTFIPKFPQLSSVKEWKFDANDDAVKQHDVMKLLPDVISTPDSLPDSLPVGMVTPN